MAPALRMTGSAFLICKKLYLPLPLLNCREMLVPEVLQAHLGWMVKRFADL